MVNALMVMPIKCSKYPLSKACLRVEIADNEKRAAAWANAASSTGVVAECTPARLWCRRVGPLAGTTEAGW